MSGTQLVVRCVLAFETNARAETWKDQTRSVLDRVRARNGAVFHLDASKARLTLGWAFGNLDGATDAEALVRALQSAASHGATGDGFSVAFVDYQDPEGDVLSLAGGAARVEPLRGKAISSVERAASSLLEELADPRGEAKRRSADALAVVADLVREALDRLAREAPEAVWSAYEQSVRETRGAFFVGKPKNGADLLALMTKNMAPSTRIPADFGMPLRLVSAVDQGLGERLAIEAHRRGEHQHVLGAAIDGLAHTPSDAAVELALRIVGDSPPTYVLPRGAAVRALALNPHASIDARVLDLLITWRKNVEAERWVSHEALDKARYLFRLAGTRATSALRDAMYEAHASLVAKPRPWDSGALRALTGREFLQATLPLLDRKLRAATEAAIREAAGEDERPIHPAVRAVRRALGESPPPKWPAATPKKKSAGRSKKKPAAASNKKKRSSR